MSRRSQFTASSRALVSLSSSVAACVNRPGENEPGVNEVAAGVAGVDGKMGGNGIQ